MSFFGALVKTVVNVATLPVNIVLDAATALPDATTMTGQDVGERTKKNLEKLKEEASDE